MARRQLDLFGEDAQGELFQEPSPAGHAPLVPDLDDIRARLYGLLAKARAAKTLPWDQERTRLYCTVFPQMASWLPVAEADQLRFDFARELERLTNAA
jgi:hypothetical protein